MSKSLKNRWLVPVFVLVLGVFAAQVWAEGTPPVPAGSAPGVPGTDGGGASPQQPGLFGMLMPFLLMFGVLYFLIIRPQQKKMKDQQQMISSLAYGDEVVTSSGILGKINGIAEKVVTLEIADNVRIKILKSQIAQVVKDQIKELNNSV